MNNVAQKYEIIKSIEIRKKFAEDGYLVLPNFVDDNGVDELDALYEKYKPQHKINAIYSNIEDNPSIVNEEIEQKIKRIFQPSIDLYFQNYRFFGGSFLIKGNGIESETLLHQDWTLVDEKQFISFSIWVPLQDVEEKNGCLKVLPGSHNWFETIRSVNISSLYYPFDEEILPSIVSLPIKKGTAIVFAVNLFHGSSANLTQYNRKAMHIVLTNKEADFVHYIWDKEKECVLKVECTKDFLYDSIFNISKGGIPENLKIIETLNESQIHPLSPFTFKKKISSLSLNHN